MRAASENELERLRLGVALCGDAVYEWDLASGAMTWTPNALEVLGTADGEPLDTFEAFLARVEPEDRTVLKQVHARHFDDRQRFECEYRFRRGDGTCVRLLDRGIVEFDHAGQPERIIGAVRNLQRGRPADAQLTRLANFDELTGQYNRTRLREALCSALAFSLRHHMPGSFLLVGIDNLTLINYTHGQAAGDAAVLAVSRALDSCLRASDVVGRVGNDQFGIVLNGCKGEQVPVIAEKILDAVQRAAYEERKSHLLLTVTIGVVLYPETVREAHDAIAKAEIALEQARRAGRNCYAVYNLSEQESQTLRVSLSTAETVQAALKENRLSLDFQPVVEAHTGKVAYHECLVRMVEPDGARVSAGNFMPIVEQMGLARPLDRRVLEMVVRELAEHPDVHLAMNISGLSAGDPAWFRLFDGLLKDHPDVAPRLMVEITETAVLEDIREAVRFAHMVRERGCRIALDDFGAGYTSFRHLQEMAVDVVKIDGSFIRSLGQRSDARLFVRTLQTFADGLGLATVAECVETAEVANLVTGHGVHYLQGYYFGRPTPHPPWREAPAPAHEPHYPALKRRSSLAG
jgi:diguanylate cyclase (GGDEF)-like protein